MIMQRASGAYMIVKKRKRQITFSVGELVRINIPRIDRAGIDRKSLPCKVLETLDGGYYRLGCVFGVLDRCYLAGEMETVSAEFPELEKIPETRISLTAAAVNALCHCKSVCTTRRCACRKAGVACSSRCHSSISCTNKDN